MAYVNPLSNLSYTNKDFNTIFPELLDLVKTLTYKWDPSISNESDPGVVLLKLNALIADKCNYNSDKNVLESFPLSVTQDTNARQLYSQLGYYMHWYRSAMTKINMVWTNTDYINSSDIYCTIPKFTMVTDYDNSVVYTLLGPTVGENAISDQRLILDGSTLSWNAIQGIAVNYDINGETTITANMLDKDNRIYFLTNDIAENGIFITHAGGQNDYNLWKRKDNLLIEQTVFDKEVDTITYSYAFGVLPNSNTCYLEFPENAVEMFNNGINITYIKTNALNGNIPYNFIEKFETDVTVSSNYDSGTSMVLNAENVKLLNVVAGTGGLDKESLNDAYKGYKRTVGTYNTLVTLRDYINACLNSGKVSNGFVTSRRDDIQCEYNLMTTVEGVNTRISKLDTMDLTASDTPVTPALTAFNLKFYMTKFVNTTIDNATDYNNTYKLMTEKELIEVKAYIENQKSLEHDYTKLLTPYTYIAPDNSPDSASKFRSHICMFINRFPIEARIISKYPLTSAEKEEVSNNIKTAFYGSLSAKNMEFGEAPNNLEIKALVETADPRIADVNIYDFVYETIAVYWSGEEFVEINLSKPLINVAEFRNLKAANPNEILESDYNLEYKISCSLSSAVITPKYHQNEQGKYIDDFKDVVGNHIGWGLYKFKYLGDFSDVAKWVWWPFTGTGDYAENWQDLPSGTRYSDFFNLVFSGRLPIGTIVTIEINPVEFIKDEILAKSILAGATPLLEEDNSLGFDLNQKLIKQRVEVYNESTESYEFEDVPVVENVYKIKGNCELTISPTDILTLKEHENLQFFAPNLISGETYNNYVKYEYQINGTDGLSKIPKNASYQLKANEYIAFYWKDSDYDDSVYQYHIYGPGHILSPTFDMTIPTERSLSSATLSLIGTLQGQGGTELASEWYHNMSNEDSDTIASLVGDYYYLSGTKEVSMKYLNTVELDGSAKIYWILNESFDDKYILFAQDQRDPDGHGGFLDQTTYILNSGEYFIYANSALSELMFLGAGSKITRKNDFREWSVNVISRETISQMGGVALEDFWYPLESTSQIELVEQQYYNLGENCSIKTKTGTYTLTATAQAIPNSEEIKYTMVDIPAASDWITLPIIMLNSASNSTWACRSNLTLDIGPEIAQQIEVNHTIYYTLLHDPDGTNNVYEIQGVDPSSSSYPKMFKLSQAINSSETSGYMTTYETNEAGEKKYASLYVFTKLTDSADGTVKYRTSGGASLYFLRENRDASGNITVQLQFAVPTSDEVTSGYILPLYNPYGDLNSLTCTLTSSGTTVPVHILNKDQGSSSPSQLAEPGMYFLDLQLAGNKTYTLEVKLHGYGVAETRVITLNELFKYNVNYALVSKYSRICELFETSFDEKGQFNYTYSVPEAQLIADPLDPKSFLDVNHIYNKFTICQLDVSKQTLKIFGGTE